MAVESYEQIMARLNRQQTQTPKAATDFSTYVQNLLLNTNPQGGMMSDAEAYRADPFRRQNAINASLEEALKKKQVAAGGGGGGGMFGMGGSGSDSPTTRNAIQEREDALRAANLPEDEVQAIMAAEQEARGRAINDFLTNLSKGGLFGIASQLLGGTLVAPGMNAPVETRTGKTPAQIAQEQRDLQAAAIAQQQQEAAQAAAIQRAQEAQARASESGIPAVSRSGGGSFTVVDSGGGSTTYTGSGGYGGGGSLESTYGGGL
jgi:hypothetical protein